MAGGAWEGPRGQRLGEEEVFRAMLYMMDAGDKRKPIIATGPPGQESSPMRWYYLRYGAHFDTHFQSTIQLVTSIYFQSTIQSVRSTN